ncbi:terpene cyclase/mutase family protein [Candidatus Nomurabacteria bacterium]|nr:terpene cyclase/mutase family protein [Candidatus Nomurabacteria bacterium]
MKNQIFKIVLLGFMVLGFFGTAHAAPLNIDIMIDVPASCTVTDKNGVVYSYPETTSMGSYLAICAFDAATKNGSSVLGAKFSNFPGLGLQIDSINDVVPDPSSQYWAIYKNGTSPDNFSMLGISSLPVVAQDTIIFKIDNWAPGSTASDQVILHINSLIPVSSGGGPLITYTNPTTTDSPTITAPATPPAKLAFDTQKAYDFLIAQQNADGSWGSDLYTDWAALSLASGNNQAQVLKLIKYFGISKITALNITDYERHAMALMSLGLNPYDTNGENYIKKITDSFDGKQFGDANQDNDDIFALIVLQNAGYTQNDQMINADISFVLSEQNTNGSWDGSVDMTGAAIEALAMFNKIQPLPALPLSGEEKIPNALTKAEDFLKQNQKDDGSWNDNASSTAWALEGILAMNEKPEDWAKNGNTPSDYLATIQDTDGGVKNESVTNKTWETAYVTSALSGKSWNQVMQSFTKPEMPAVTETPLVKVKSAPIPEISATKNPKPKSMNVANNPSTQNTASVINALTPAPEVPQTETPKKNWFMRLLGNIFGN